MKLFKLLFSTLLLITYFPALNFAQIHIHSDFEHGSVGSLKEISENVFSGQTMHWIKKDQIGNQFYWFYFRMDGVKNKSLTIQFDNCIGTYREHTVEQYTDYTQPVLSYDQQNWQRIKNVEYIKSVKRFTFSFFAEKDTVWLAYAHPYTLSRSNAFIDSIKNNKYVKTQTIGHSHQGRNIRMITVTNPEMEDANKKVILMTALQHSGEDCGGYVVEGIINELLSEKKDMEYIKNNFIFKILPVMNPDGMFHGVARYNWVMEDLNSEWDDDVSDSLNLPVEPEVVALKKWTQQWLSNDNHIDLFFDIHSNSQRNKRNALHNDANHLEPLVDFLNPHWPIITVSHGFKGSAADFFHNYYNIPAGTIELTQSFTKEEQRYLQINDYLGYGKGLLLAVRDYFKNQK